MPLRFSVTKPPQFEFRQVPLIPGTDVMRGSVFQDFNSLAGILKNLQPTRVKDDDYENIEEFVEAPDYRNPLQKALDFYKESPQARLGIGALLGGPVGALASLFAPKIFVFVLASEASSSIKVPTTSISDFLTSSHSGSGLSDSLSCTNHCVRMISEVTSST